MRKNIYLSAFAASLLAMGFTSCSNEDFGGAKQEAGSVSMTVGISKADLLDGETRTTLSENSQGDLDCVWDSNDKVMVTDENGNLKGYLTIMDGAGSSFAHFHTDKLVGITSDTKKLNFTYLGKEYNTKEIPSVNPIEYKYGSQEGTIASLNDKDILIGKNVDVEVYDGEAYSENIQMKRINSFGHFELVFTDGTKRTSEPIKITGTGLQNYIGYYKTCDLAYTALNGGITITGNPGNDFYVNIPVQITEDITPTFTVTIGGKEYKGSLPTRNWKQGEYVRASVGKGVSVEMKTDAPVVDHSKNPLAKWADGNLVYNKTTGKSTVSTNIYERGSLYQWGRSYGYSGYEDALNWDSSTGTYHIGGYGISAFSTGMGITYSGSYGYTYKTGSLYENINPLKNNNLRDYFFMSKPSEYTSNIQLVNSAPLVGYMSVSETVNNVNADYWPSAYSGGGSTWSARSTAMGESSVCPSGYRIPRYEEYGQIFPSATQLTSESSFKTSTSKSEVRTLADGTKYAINWSWTTNGSQQVLVIKALVVPKSYTTSDITTATWSDKNVVVKYFPATGGIKAFYHQNKYNNNGTVVTVNLMQPVPFGKWTCYLRTSPVIHISYENFSDAGYNYQGGYWISDQKAIATFRLDNGSRFGYNNNTSYIGRIVTPAQDAHAIRCVKDE